MAHKLAISFTDVYSDIYRLQHGLHIIRDLARIFITGCPNWDFKNLGCPKSLFEKVKTITLIVYINI